MWLPRGDVRAWSGVTAGVSRLLPGGRQDVARGREGQRKSGGQHPRRMRQGPTAPSGSHGDARIEEGKAMPAVAPATSVQGREPDPRTGADEDRRCRWARGGGGRRLGGPPQMEPAR